MLRFLSLLALPLLLSAPLSAAEPARILVVGDSLMAINGISGNSVAHRLARHLGQPVQSRAKLGAWAIYKLPITGAAGMSIPRQFRSGDPAREWIVLNGGGNDLWLGCGCGRCERKLDRLAATDGKSGAVLAMLADLRRTGAQVLYVGYLRSPGFDTPIEHCLDEGEALESRVSAFAEKYRGIHYLSIADLVPEGDRSLHAPDLIHPSIKGSDAIAQRIAAYIRAH